MGSKRRKKTRGATPWGEWFRAVLTEEQMSLLRAAGMAPDYILRNNVYQVHVRTFDCPVIRNEDGSPVRMTHLSIKRNDREAIHDWRELQRIKTELCGKEAEGVELYPAESRLTDRANQFHLWVLPEGMPWPFGFFDPRCVQGPEVAARTGAKQRPFDSPPDDLDDGSADAAILERLRRGR